MVIEEGITGIGNWAFYDCDSMSTVGIPQSVSSIGDEAFYRCDNMSTIEIPQSVTTIGDGVFDFCKSLIAIEVDSGNLSYQSLEGVLYSGDGTTLICCPPGNERSEYTIPDGVMTIGSLSFGMCRNLTSVEIPSSVQTIASQAFLDCGIQTIRIPANVTWMTHAPFSYCGSLRYIEVDSGNPNYKSVDGVLFTKDGTVLICCPAENDRTTYTIPEGVTRIDSFALTSCGRLTGVEIPESVNSIGGNAFQSCWSLRTLRIPKSVTRIGDMAFTGCSGLTDLYYGGTKAQWEELVGDKDLGLEEGVAIHFES